MRNKNVMVYLIITLFMHFLLLFCYTEIAAASTASINSFYKTDYAEDTLSKGLDPNVLFLLDTSTAMTFTPNGVMPNQSDDRTFEQRGKLLAESTYGHGMRPPVFKGRLFPSGREATRIYGGAFFAINDGGEGNYSYNRFGRDLIDENNKIGDPYCYYTSEPNKFFLLTFKNRHLAHYEGWIRDVGGGVGAINPPNFSLISTNLPKGEIVGGPPTSVDIREAQNAYAALSPHIPQRYRKNESGVWIPELTADGKHPRPIVTKDSPAHEHIIPNDSRIYMMKLVLWRLTEEVNAGMFTRMNVAAAMTYQECDSGAANIATKYAKPDAKPGERLYYGASEVFRFGGAARYVTGYPSDFTIDIHGERVSYFQSSQMGFKGVETERYYRYSYQTPLWKATSRAILIAPFNKFYRLRENGILEGTDKLSDFRGWLSGFEVYTISDEIYPHNPASSDAFHPTRVRVDNAKNELYASSLTMLSTAIYGGQNSSEGIPNAPYHKGVKNANSPSVTGNTHGGTKEFILLYGVRSRDNAGADSPSDSNPRLIYLYPSINSEGLPAGQATGSVFDFFNPTTTSNNDGVDGLNFADNSIGFFPVTGSCQQNWLVIFCAGNDAVPGYEPHDAVRRLFRNTLEMRGRRFDTARNRWVSEKYEMDSGVRTLVVGFISPDNPEPEVVKIKADLIKMAKEGDPLEITQRGDLERRFISNDFAVPEFAYDVAGLIKALNTVLRRIYVERMGSGNPENQPAIDDITNPDVRVVFGASYRMNNLDQWDAWLTQHFLRENQPPEFRWEVNPQMINAGLNRRLFTSTGAANSTSVAVAQITPQIIQTLAGVPSTLATRFRDWIYRFNNDNNPTSESVGILGDMQNSGITVVGRPRHRDLLANNEIKSRDAVVYVQTNRGFLHAFRYDTGSEIWGFSPPNVFQARLRNLKTTNNGAAWIEGNGFTKERSRPMALLDGLLIARDVTYNGTTRTLLTGYLGRGGNGFYTMDITKMDAQNRNPIFEWAIENPRYRDRSATLIRWGKAAGSRGNFTAYSDLGLTINPGVYFTPANRGGYTVGVLPGGLGHKLGADSQGKAFYIFNPTDGSLLHTINTRNSGFVHPTNNNLVGMGVSPIVYQENSAKETVAFYTADSDGNILKCDTTVNPITHWQMRSIFQFLTIGSQPGNSIQRAGDPVVIPKRMLLGRATKGGQLWLFGGTSDLHGPDSYENDARKIINNEQFLFGLNTNRIIAANPETRNKITPSDSQVRKLTYYADGIPDEYGRYGDPNYSKSNETGIKFGMNDFGWVLRLRPKFGTTEAEYLSANPVLFNDVMYFATFIPRVGLRSQEACESTGVGKLYALDPSTGHSYLDVPAIVLENIKIAGIALDPNSNRLTLSVKELSPHSVQTIRDKFDNVVDLGNGLVIIDAPVGIIDSPPGEPDTDYEELVPHIQYWRESFKY